MNWGDEGEIILITSPTQNQAVRGGVADPDPGAVVGPGSSLNIQNQLISLKRSIYSTNVLIKYLILQ